MRDPFVEVGRLVPPDGLWGEVLRRSSSASPQAPPPGPSRGRRVVAIAVAFGVFAAAATFAWRAIGPTERHSRPADPSPTPTAIIEDPLADLPEGWSDLPAPPEVRSEAATAWTGEALLIWGGYVFEGSGDKPPSNDGFMFDAAMRSWTSIPASPLSSRSAAASVWTGSELVIWGGWDGSWDAGPGTLSDGAAFEPGSGAWRTLPPAPISARAPFSVWTGHEMIVWGTAVRVSDPPRDGAAYDPTTDSWWTIAEAPIGLTDGTAVWTGQEMIVFGAALHGGNDAETPTAIGAAYDPNADTWRRLPDSALSPQASTAAWNGREMIAWDYLNGSAAYDPDTDSWRTITEMPLDPAECSPDSVAVGSDVLGDYCGAVVLFESDRDRWREIPPPDTAILEPVAAGDVALLPSHDLRTEEVRMLAFRPRAPAPDVETVVAEGVSNGVDWSLVAEIGGGQDALELRAAEGKIVRLQLASDEELQATTREFGEGDPDDVVVFGVAPPGTHQVQLVPGQGLPEVTVAPVPIPGTDRLAFSLRAYAGIGILTATSEEGSALARELLLPPGGARVRSFVDAFLATRVSGSAAEAFLAPGATERSGHDLGDLGSLYNPGRGYDGSSITFISGPSEPDGSWEVGVLLRMADRRGIEETLFVGPGVDGSGVPRDLLVLGGRGGLTGP